jgi:hypothetical protein
MILMSNRSVSIDKMADEIIIGLKDYGNLVEDDMKKAVKKVSTQVKNDIKSGAPKQTGRYQKSWATKKTMENSHALEMTVYSKNRYQIAHLLEKGHAKKGGGRVAARVHIATAEQSGVELLETLIKKAIQE